jgi:hypothetical protein
MWSPLQLIKKWIDGLCVLIPITTLISSIANSAPVKVAQTKVNDTEITTILMSDKLLGPFIAVNAIQLIVFLAKWIFSREAKRQEEILKAVSLIPGLMTKVNDMDEHLKKNVPTHDAVELKIYRALKDKH